MLYDENQFLGVKFDFLILQWLITKAKKRLFLSFTHTLPIPLSLLLLLLFDLKHEWSTQHFYVGQSRAGGSSVQ